MVFILEKIEDGWVFHKDQLWLDETRLCLFLGEIALPTGLHKFDLDAYMYPVGLLGMYQGVYPTQRSANSILNYIWITRNYKSHSLKKLICTNKSFTTCKEFLHNTSTILTLCLKDPKIWLVERSILTKVCWWFMLYAYILYPAFLINELVMVNIFRSWQHVISHLHMLDGSEETYDFSYAY